MKWWSSEVGLKHGDISRTCEDDSWYEENEVAEASYFPSIDTVYAESIVSQEDADAIVIAKCIDLRDKFDRAVRELQKGIVTCRAKN